MSESKELLAQQVEDGAKTYWMLGWSWDEIESVFDDLGVPEDVIERGVKKARNYARDTIKKGPFHKYHKRQLVRLNNGETGQLSHVLPDSLMLIMPDGTNMYVKACDVDQEATEALTQAYVLRKMANSLRRAKGEDYLVPVRPERFEIKPEEKEPPLSVTVKTSPGAPPGWSKITPHINEVQEVSDTVGQMLNEIDAAQKELVTVKSDLKVANQMANEVRARRKELEKRQHEIAQNIFAIIGSQNEALNEIDHKFFVKYKNKLVGLRRKITEEQLGVGVVEELEALKEILEQNHPRIFNKVMDALETYKETNTSIIERMENLFAYYTPAEKKFGFMAGWWSDVKNWVFDLWDDLKAISEDLYDYTFPEIDESIAAIDEFTHLVSSTARASKLNRLVRSF